MRYATSEYLGLRVSYTFCMGGETHKFRAGAPIARADMATTQYWGGDFRYEMPDGSTLADIHRGMLGIDLPDFPVAGDYTLRAMADGAFYYCVTRKDKGPIQKQRIQLAAGMSLTIPQGRVAFVDDGAEVRIIVTKNAPADISGPAQGLIVWI